MKIVFVHMGVLPVKTYGGTERILFWHMKELVRQGHQVALIGNKNSEVTKYGIDLIPLEAKDEQLWPTLIPNDADLVHLQWNWQQELGIPHVCTVHGNGKPGETFYKNTVFVSKRHAQNHQSKSYVHNAIDFEEYPFEAPKKQKWDEFLFLAKASWRVKNVKHAVKACKKAKKILHIAGGKVLSFSKYIKNEGFVGGQKKLDLIRQSDALVFPIRWEEPFGIAVIEAMSQGRPVVVSPYGSMKELVTPEVGFICNNYLELEQVIIQNENNFDPLIIREYAEEHFSINLYTQRYVELYKKVVAGRSLNDQNPHFPGPKRAEDLLPF
ncbi:glycosyltransferase [Halobacteriovorax sp. GB3]|uniref:glycosyltransferase n=1 Tax=Halobacteriovorax sp. GB3 TaxID=2719615 RepID=UPI00235E495E|nr:glycosyltransferase [Halobacteriovorax sp. GB3]MDD0852567.1 glycosyltransferase [Halobacteriovorax sp. GB3]